MLHDPVADKHFWRLYDTFPAYQLVLLDSQGELAALGNTIPVTWDGSLHDLPDEGWDAILERGVSNFYARITPNCVSAIQAVVAPRYQRQGISQEIVKAMHTLVRQHGFTRLIAPVRPSLKHRYPLTSIERYIDWRHTDGLNFDPWLRTHQRLGAQIEKVCPRSMTISSTVAKWEEWAGMRFPESGVYIVPGALSPVPIDLETSLGTYIEPNVWMLHQLVAVETR